MLDFHGLVVIFNVLYKLLDIIYHFRTLTGFCYFLKMKERTGLGVARTLNIIFPA